MKLKWLKINLLAFLLIAALINTGCAKGNTSDNVRLPSLPRPIAAEDVLITSAGQCTDAYVIRDIANQLLIHNFFMPQANDTNLEDINTLVVVVGYSPLGMKLNSLTYEDEKKRISQLLEKARSKDLTVITLFIGGKQRREAKTDALLKLICSKTDYLIGTQNANYDNFLVDVARENSTQITLVDDVGDIAVPFTSAFR